MLLPIVLRKSWTYQVLPFIVSRENSPIGNKIPDREFYWSDNLEFYSGLSIWNSKSTWSTRKLMPLRKIESSSEKKALCHRKILFFQTSENSVRKRKVYKMKVVMLNPAIKGYYKFYWQLLGLLGNTLTFYLKMKLYFFL